MDAIVRGDRPRGPFAALGRTPDLLVKLGLSPAKLVMTVGKIATCRREHPEVSLDVWHRLPGLIDDPLAVFPSVKDDGSLIVVLVVNDAVGNPVLVPVEPGRDGTQNVVLSVYGKDAGHAWIAKQVVHAARHDLPLFLGKGFAATLPQPGFAEAIPSSPGPIPADGTTKPERQILSLKDKVKNP